MDNKNVFEEIKRLNFEDFLWIVFIFLSITNIYGDYNEKEYLKIIKVLKSKLIIFLN